MSNASYRWLVDADYSEWLSTGYCVTSVTSITPPELMGRLGAEPRGSSAGFADLVEKSYAGWGSPEAGVVQLAAFGAVGTGSVMIEVNGYLGITDQLMTPVSHGRDVVSHFRNVNQYDRLVWWRDGRTELDIEPVTGVPRGRELTPKARALTTAYGIPPSRDAWSVAAAQEFDAHLFALAEHVSGLRVSRELLEGELLLGAVRLPA